MVSVLKKKKSLQRERSNKLINIKTPAAATAEEKKVVNDKVSFVHDQTQQTESKALNSTTEKQEELQEINFDLTKSRPRRRSQMRSMDS